MVAIATQTKYKYPFLRQYAQILRNPSSRKMFERNDIVDRILVNLNRHEISNVALVGPPGVGKTTVMYSVAQRDKGRRYYYSINLTKMAADGSSRMAYLMGELVDEVRRFQRDEHSEIVLFMDEFHLIDDVSPETLEVLKPVLANSGAEGIRIVVATTYEEYNKKIRKNDALNQRLELVKVPELTFDETLVVLRNFWLSYYPTLSVDERLLRHLIETTDKVIPSEAQPRKSVRALDAMFGWYDTFKTTLDDNLLYNVLKDSVGVDLNYKQDVAKLESNLNKRVFDQPLAVNAVTNRLYMSVAGLNDETRPRGSFLFTGPTGSGKTELCKAISDLLFGSEDYMIRFDMSEYAMDKSVDVLRKQLTEKIWERPNSVILFDEIEKASPTCSKLTLQLLDDARMTDEHGRQASFKDCFVVFTTNAGAKIFDNVKASLERVVNDKTLDSDQYNRKLGEVMSEYMRIIKTDLESDESRFPPELLGRIDSICPFSNLNEPTRFKVCDRMFDALAKVVYQKHGAYLHYTDDARNFIVREHVGNNDAKDGGGRDIRRRVDTNIVAPLSTYLLLHPDVIDISVEVEGQMAWANKTDRVGTARIVIDKWKG